METHGQITPYHLGVATGQHAAQNGYCIRLDIALDIHEIAVRYHLIQGILTEFTSRLLVYRLLHPVSGQS